MGECNPERCKRQKTQPCIRSASTEAKHSEATWMNYCEAKCPEGFGCTRDKGHKGEHEAHSAEGKAVARWPNEKRIRKKG